MRNKVVTCIWRWSSGAGMMRGTFSFFHYLSVILESGIILPRPMTWTLYGSEPLWAGLGKTGKLWLSTRDSACISRTRGEKGVARGGREGVR